MRLFRKKIKDKTEVKTLEALKEERNTIVPNFEVVENLIKRMTSDIDAGIDEITGPDYRIITMVDWLNAMRQADLPWNNSYTSSWVQLFDIYTNMLTDTHMQACVDTLTEGVLSKDFYIANSDGSKNEEITRLFKNKWFYDYQEAVVNVRLWGFGLVQLEDFNQQELTLNVREVNRRHVRPDLSGVVKQPYDQQAWRFWDKEPYRTSTVYLFDAKLGKLNACVRYWIYKTEVARLWSVYNQIYGTPSVLGKTSLKDKTRRTNLVDALKNFIKTRFIVMDKEDEVMQMTTQSTGNQQLFENFMRLCDEQISKALLGSTMVLDNGSSKSQSEIHETNTGKFINSTDRTVVFSTNNDLIPRLRKIGFPIPEGCFMVRSESEKTTMKERAEIVNLMNLKYTIPASTAGEFVGIEVEEKEEEVQLNVIAREAIEDYKKRLSE